MHEMPDLEEIIRQASKVLCEDAALLRRVQIYLCHRFSGQTLKDIGLHFGIGVSGVSQASRRVALQIKGDKKLKKLIAEIISELGLSTVLVYSFIYVPTRIRSLPDHIQFSMLAIHQPVGATQPIP